VLVGRSAAAVAALIGFFQRSLFHARPSSRTNSGASSCLPVAPSLRNSAIAGGSLSFLSPPLLSFPIFSTPTRGSKSATVKEATAPGRSGSIDSPRSRRAKSGGQQFISRRRCSRSRSTSLRRLTFLKAAKGVRHPAVLATLPSSNAMFSAARIAAMSRVTVSVDRIRIFPVLPMWTGASVMHLVERAVPRCRLGQVADRLHEVWLIDAQRAELLRDRGGQFSLSCCVVRHAILLEAVYFFIGQVRSPKAR